MTWLYTYGDRFILARLERLEKMTEGKGLICIRSFNRAITISLIPECWLKLSVFL